MARRTASNALPAAFSAATANRLVDRRVELSEREAEMVARRARDAGLSFSQVVRQAIWRAEAARWRTDPAGDMLALLAAVEITAIHEGEIHYRVEVDGRPVELAAYLKPEGGFGWRRVAGKGASVRKGKR